MVLYYIKRFTSFLMYTPLLIQHPSSDENTVVAGCLLINVVILLVNQFIQVGVRILILVVGAACMVYLQPLSKGRLFALTTTVCLLTVIHTAVSFSIGDLIWRAMMVFRDDFYAQERTVPTMGAFHDRDYSIADGAAILTHETQAAIHASQSRCHSNMTVYQVRGYVYGMGSELHWHAAALAFAMEQEDALFVWGAGACEKFSAHCRDLYEREHMCTEDEIGRMEVVNLTTVFPQPIAPARFIAQLPQSFTVAQIEYWWRSQAIGYLMRFNSKTTREVNALRSRLHGNMSLSGAINVNIRSGDKTREARLASTEHYIDTAAALIASQPLSYSRVLFLTSDSLREIQTAQAYARMKQLQAVYSDIPRMKYGHDQDSVDSFWSYNVTVSVLLQLSMAAECDAWIGTRSSNWNRLIDIYRCARVYKCKQVFVEAGDTLDGHYDSNPTLWL